MTATITAYEPCSRLVAFDTRYGTQRATYQASESLSCSSMCARCLLQRTQSQQGNAHHPRAPSSNAQGYRRGCSNEYPLHTIESKDETDLKTKRQAVEEDCSATAGVKGTKPGRPFRPQRHANEITPLPHDPECNATLLSPPLDIHVEPTATITFKEQA